MALGVYNGAGSGTTKLLLHMEGNSNDSSGNSNNGSDTDITYSLANGKLGQGAGFDGDSSKISISNSSNFQFNYADAVTINLWVKFDSSSSGAQFLFSQACGDLATYYGYHGFWFFYSFTSERLSLNYVPADGVDNYARVDSLTLSKDTWYNIVVSKGTGGVSTWKFFINGLEYSTNTSYVGNGNLPTARYTFIGHRDQFLNPDHSYYWLYGAIDEFILENRAWTAEEVKKHYTYSKGRFGNI